MTNTLLHLPVIIHPDLRTDLLHMQGAIGYISTANLKKDDFFIDFPSGKTGLYSANALLVLRAHDEVYRRVMTRHDRLDTQEFKDMMRISMLLQSAGNQHAREALQLALSTSRVLLLATQPLSEQLHIHLAAAASQITVSPEPGR